MAARRGARADEAGPRLSRRLLLRRALGASTIVWLPVWAACGDDDGGDGDGGDAAAGDGGSGGTGGRGALDASISPDAAHDAGPIEPGDSGFDAGALLVDSCEPLLTPLGAFFVATGGEGTVKGWHKPDLSAGDYRLVIDGEVATPRSLGLAELAAAPQTSMLKTMQCVFGQRGTGIYRGVTVRTLLEQAGIDRDATVRVRFHGADGFGNNLRLDDLYPASAPSEPRVSPLIALTLDGAPLSRDHGYPARLVLPDRFGFKNVKWLTRIEATASDEPFGDYQAIGLASDAAVIALNTAFHGQHRVRAGAPGVVTLCGQTLSGGGAIERVEITIDGAAPETARIVPLSRLLELEPSLRETEQVQQGYPYPFVGVATPWEHDFVADPGEHEVRIQAYDTSGASSAARAVLVFDDERDAG